MSPEELQKAFDQMAPSYDQVWGKMAPVYRALYFLLEGVFSGLPHRARVLCVGAGTGNETLHLAQRFPNWTFTALDRSPAMLEVCQDKAKEAGVLQRCRFFAGVLEDLPEQEPFDGATCLLVSQFFLDPKARQGFYARIAQRLKAGSLLALADMAADQAAPDYPRLLSNWSVLMNGGDASPEKLAQMRANYAQNVAILPPQAVEGFLTEAGFEAPIRFFQGGLLQAWQATKAP